MELTGAEICKIIKTCADNGVLSLKLGDLDVVFDGEAKHDPVGVDIKFENTVDYDAVLKRYPPTEDAEPSTRPEIHPVDEELDDALLMMEDPAEWQRRQLNESEG